MTPVTDNIPVYAVSTKRKRDNNYKPDARDNQQRMSQTNTSSTSGNIPIYALPNHGKKITSSSNDTAGHVNEPDDAYAYASVTIDLENENEQHVIEDTTGWTENDIYDTRNSTNGDDTEGWEDNKIYLTTSL